MRVSGLRYDPAALPLGETRYPLYKRPDGLEGRSGWARKTSTPQQSTISLFLTLGTQFTFSHPIYFRHFCYVRSCSGFWREIIVIYGTVVSM